MEKKQQKRVFAYTQAKIIDNDALSNVAGGNAQMMTQRQTVRGTSNGIDVAFDISFDW